MPVLKASEYVYEVLIGRSSTHQKFAVLTFVYESLNPIIDVLIVATDSIEGQPDNYPREMRERPRLRDGSGLEIRTVQSGTSCDLSKSSDSLVQNASDSRGSSSKAACNQMPCRISFYP